LLGYCDHRAERFHYDEIIKPGETHVWGDLEWRALAAPGHDMGALVFYNPEHRILISGDALWQDGYGLVMPLEIDPRALPATRATLDMLAQLDIRTVIPGHGEPFDDVAVALERAFHRTTAFEADTLRVARHALKAVFMFALLDKQRLAAELPAHRSHRHLSRFNQRSSAFPRRRARLLLDSGALGAVRRENGGCVRRCQR
jgi:glyoxylase-like metal-dependent hydrolase (beta-lactamase superfamily II)